MMSSLSFALVALPIIALVVASPQHQSQQRGRRVCGAGDLSAYFDNDEPPSKSGSGGGGRGSGDAPPPAAAPRTRRRYWVELCGRDYSLLDQHAEFGRTTSFWRTLGAKHPHTAPLQFPFNHPLLLTDLALEDIRAADELHFAMMKAEVHAQWAQRTAAIAAAAANTEQQKEDEHKHRSRERRGMRVLDFGCRAGPMALLLAQDEDVASVTCADSSPQHLAVAEAGYNALLAEKGSGGGGSGSSDKKPASLGLAEFNTHVLSPDVLGSLDEQGAPRCFDFIYSHSFLPYFGAPLQSVFLEQMCDLLAPGGFTWITTRAYSFVKTLADLSVCHVGGFAPRLRRGAAPLETTREEVLSALARRGCRGEVAEWLQEYGGNLEHRGTVLIRVTKEGDDSRVTNAQQSMPDHRPPLAGRCDCRRGDE